MGLFKHRHHYGSCAECLHLYEAGKERGMEMQPVPMNAEANQFLMAQLNEAKEELRKARLKIDVYEKMFAALRIPVLPKENV